MVTDAHARIGDDLVVRKLPKYRAQQFLILGENAGTAGFGLFEGHLCRQSLCRSFRDWAFGHLRTLFVADCSERQCIAARSGQKLTFA